MKRGFFRDGSHPSAFLAAIACGAGLWSCDVNDKPASESSLARLAAGDSLEFRLPTREMATASASLEFGVDSGKTYTVAWSDPGSSVAMSVTAATGSAPYQELSTDIGGFEHAIQFPATKSGNLKLVAAGAPGAAFLVGLRARDGFTIPVALPDSFEYDDLRQGAQPLGVDGSWQRHTFTTSERPDVDWLRFDVDSGNVYAVVREDSLLSGATMSLFTADSLSLDGRSFVANRKGRIYCRVAAPSGRGGFYRIRLEAAKGLPAGYLAPDRYESDNMLATASALPLDSSWQERTLPIAGSLRDVDFIRIDGDSGRTYRIRFRPSDTNYSAASARIIGPDSMPVVFRSSTYRHDGTFIVPCTRRGPFFVEVGSNGYATSYRIAAVAVEGLPDWVLPTGLALAGASKATAASFGSDSVETFSGWLRGDDTNWVDLGRKAERFYTIEPRVLSALTGGRNIAVAIEDSAGRSNASVEGGRSRSFLVQAGSHRYLRIAPSYARSIECIQYKVVVHSFEPPSDPYEPDNSLTSAAPLRFGGKPVSRWVSWENPDWMAIQVDSGRRITVNLTGSVYGYLFDRDSAIVGQLYGGAGFATGWLDYVPKRSGSIYLNVQSIEGWHPYSAWVDTEGSDTAGTCGTIANACRVEPDSLVTQHAASASESYYFKLRTIAGSAYRFETKTNSSANLVAVDLQGEIPVSSVLANGSDLYRGYYRATEDGEIMLLASVRYRAYNSAPSYFRMRVSELRGEVDEGGLSRASDLVPNGAASSGVLLPGGVDFLKFHADSGVVHSFAATVDDSARLEILASDSVGEIAVDCAPGVVCNPRFQADRTGTWYARLAGKPRSQEINWSVSLVAYPAGQGRVDTSRAGAAQLLVDDMDSRRTMMAGDAEWYYLAADSGVAYRLVLESDRELTVSAYAFDGLDLGNSTRLSLGQGTAYLDHRQSYRSRVFFRVASWVQPSDVRDPIPYALRLETIGKANP